MISTPIKLQRSHPVKPGIRLGGGTASLRGERTYKCTTPSRIGRPNPPLDPLGLIGAIVLGLVFSLGGPSACHASHGTAAAAPIGSPLRVAADWDDLQAAMEVAVEPAQCAIVSAETLSDGSRRFELVTLRGEPGELIAWREGDAILARARLGRFGDPQAESELLAALARRLRQLHGVEWAPR